MDADGDECITQTEFDAYTAGDPAPFDWCHTGGTNQGPAYYQECVSLFGKKVFMKPVNE